MEAVCERGNLLLAYERLLKNKGSAGVDGIGATGLKEHPLSCDNIVNIPFRNCVFEIMEDASKTVK
jgi:hypothetical protein